ncbi:gephyrin-like molybdotransferase Glp [Litorivivens sp.]|uniref:molybdopterin molybdotransferase MoeA n=1 Tax=Litorivivens sp. TaxID=2020868 RepID=UPI003566993B
MALMPVDEALAQLLADVTALPAETCPLEQLAGRVLRQVVTAQVNVPPLDNSAMDGYALRVADAALPQIPVSQRIAAGEVGGPLQTATAARIFTGAPIPPGADCVVMQEDCEVLDGAIRVLQVPRAGQHIRPAGQDICAGEEKYVGGERLRAADVGLLAALGLAEALVSTRPRVALLSTGDELVEPGEPLATGQIYNSNRALLTAMLRGLGCEVRDCGIVEDTAAATARALRQAAEHCDLIISTGGVSAGEEDHVKAQVEKLGQLKLWKLAIKPGKPLAYGRIGKAAFFGLPGNPSSGFVTFLVLVKPYLLAMQGATKVLPEHWPVIADFDWPKAGGRQEYLRARVEVSEGRLKAVLYNNQSSGVLASAAWANALVVIPAGRVIQKGESVDVLLLNELLA